MIFRKTLACVFVITATLLLLFISGCVDSPKETITSIPTTPPNTPPEAVAHSSPFSIYEGDSVSFNGLSSEDSDGSIVSYQWNFGDGESGTGATLSHKYSNAGTYTVLLTVVDDGGLKDAYAFKIIVKTKPKPIAYGYITTIALDEMKTELIKLDDDYDKYELETNVGTISYRGYTYQTHRVTFWEHGVKKIVNNVIEYELTLVTPSLKYDAKVFGYVTTITFDRKTELIKFSDNYDKYELEENVDTVSYRGYTHQTHRVILWRGDTKRVINNVVEASLGRRNIY